ncbi:putative integral membrane protein (TIGR00698 family) [Salirhabdus euzebyi]|uniref:Putative integral membrane protein (TIGR00698 family) n=1 Tax=Salirhabdus euzebyi TaxID=394506 RepID=A0A841Q5K9_9BACI|nr:YeiH family protein [Salirhabdus euzebyi]MBB6453678.1 putative integral membrane protein (TIGR00698 family) [Salirhabdus euzebyi]
METSNQVQTNQPTPFLTEDRKKYFKGLSQGLILTLIITIVADQITNLPFFSIMGIMIIAILLGMSWKSLMGVQTSASVGIGFSSKYLLRLGIILMGLRLNLQQIYDAGLSLILIDSIVIVFTLAVMIYLGSVFKVDKHLSALIAVGTAVCGAAAIVAVSSVIKSKKEFTALAVACIAILGTVGAIIYILLFPVLGLDPENYGILVGATLHELAHVIAAAVPGEAVSMDNAILTKLGRVALLIPVALVLGYMFSKDNKEETTQKKGLKNLPVPWFIFGFLAMSVVNTVNIIPLAVTEVLIDASVYLLAMAMAGLGLSINFGDFKQVGIKPVIVGVLGFAALAAIGPLLLLL